MEAAAAAESQASRQQDFKLVSRRPKPPSEPNLPSQTPPQDPGWTQSPPVAVAAERQQEKSSFSGSQAVGLPSNRKLFVCRLPLNITATKVAEIFSKFGETVEPGGGKRGPNVHHLTLAALVQLETVKLIPISYSFSRTLHAILHDQSH